MPPLGASRKYLAAIFGDADTMFELRAQAPVAGYRRPAIVEDFACGLADVDHGFNRENHAGAQLWTRAGAADMDDFGGVVEQLAQAMAAEITDHAIAMLFGVGLDRVANVADPVAGLCGFDAEHEAFIGHIDQTLGLHWHVADQEHATGVAVPAIQLRRHVDVDDVAILQFLVRRNAVANDMVDRNAAAMRIAAIAQGRGDCTAAHRHIADNVIEFFRAYAGHDMRHQGVEDFGGKAASLAHAVKAFCPVQFDGPVAGLHRLLGRHAYILFHTSDIRQ